MAQGRKTAFVICLLVGVSLIIVGLAYPSLQHADPRQWGIYSIDGQGGEPVGNLGLKFNTTDPIFAVGSRVNVEALFRPINGPPSYQYSYVVFFPNSTSPSAPPFSFTNETLPPPQFGEVSLRYNYAEDLYVGSGPIKWSTPGLQGVEVRLLAISTNTPLNTVASADNVMVVASQEALQSAETNNVIVGLTLVVIGIAIIQLYSVFSDFSRKSTEIAKEN